MECKELTGLFSDYYDNTLSVFKRETVAKHLLSCKKCNLRYKTFYEALAYIKQVPDEQLPEEFYTGLDRKLDETVSPFYIKFQSYLTMRNASVGVLGLVFGLIFGVYMSNSSTLKAVPSGAALQTSFAAKEKEKSPGRIIMRTGNVYKAGYGLDGLVNRPDSTGFEFMNMGLESKQEPLIRVLHKKYIITVNVSQYENLIKQLNTLGYVLKLPDKKELIDFKKLKPTDQIKLELDISEDGK
ncbi:MAG: hypothetical protein A2452_04180 [Candidatus Firestonebacteria bacterium RIFOXYC2_FULL_39_67]|nr:MAG: hypothetical protein A2536_08280 [Candidatus Firestonebacteria bacterium RIFOXYD2_FULL_39_29]OGF57568.1 MAG: hypothetical protein A2452_04180 [Candidatus Firestonebacteria bacterium RIFOXYC2_FULL_39_67]